MALHRLNSVTIGVPNVAATRSYYLEFGLGPDENGWLTTRDGGRQLRLVNTPTRRLVEIEVGADDDDDLESSAHNLTGFGVDVERAPHAIAAVEPVTGVTVSIAV